jgi:DNA processing protein
MTPGRSPVDERLALLVLCKHRKSGWATMARRLVELRSAVKVAQEEGLLEVDLFEGSNEWDSDRVAAADALARWEEAGLSFHGILDESYPRRLLDVRQLPPFLFTKGTLDDGDAEGVAIVGSRRASPESLNVARELARGVAEAGRVVISGLAAGVDTAAHTAALAAGRRTVAVIGTGLNRSYPAENAALQQRIAAEGLVVSRFWPDGPPSKMTFPLRNEVMSAWARGTCVVQADAKSGARMQARVALAQGRELYLYQAMESEPWARRYVEEGKARFVRSVDDLLAS